jgi:hypothetical protein
MGDGTGARGRGERAYRFFTTEGEVSLEAFLAAIARRGEAKVVTAEEGAPREPGYRLTAKGRRALGEVA